jgi:hypothetical protein
VRWARLSERAHLSAAGLSIGAQAFRSPGQRIGHFTMQLKIASSVAVAGPMIRRQFLER